MGHHDVKCLVQLGLAAAVLSLLPRQVLADEVAGASRAAFPLLTPAQAEASPRASNLTHLAPRVVGRLPPLHAPASAEARPHPPVPSPAPPRALASPGSSWEIIALPQRWERAPLQRQPDRARSVASSRDRDTWMLSLEAVTRAPIDAGGQVVLETPPGIRLFGGYAAMPEVYSARVTGLAAAVSSDPVLVAMLDRGLESGRVARFGLGWRPFRSTGVYLDAGYARAVMSGTLDASGIDGLSMGSYSLRSNIGLGFAELGYQAKIAERIVLALALGVTKVLSAETRAAPTNGTAHDPRVETAASLLDEGLEEYGITPTLGLRLGLDLI